MAVLSSATAALIFSEREEASCKPANLGFVFRVVFRGFFVLVFFLPFLVFVQSNDWSKLVEALCVRVGFRFFAALFYVMFVYSLLCTYYFNAVCNAVYFVSARVLCCTVLFWLVVEIEYLAIFCQFSWFSSIYFMYVFMFIGLVFRPFCIANT
jgi:hypothetical protein